MVKCIIEAVSWNRFTEIQVLRLEKMYNITHLLFVFWIPTTIIAFSYIFVICKFNSMKRRNRQGKLMNF